MLKSPLRYPGGKSRALPLICERMPKSFKSYREPFVGGGSVFLMVAQTYPDTEIWINDLNQELYHFWQQAKKDSIYLANRVQLVKDSTLDGRTLFGNLRSHNTPTLSSLERAVRFFILNRISFSGTTESGGYSELAFKERFTDSSIQRLSALGKLLQNVKVTNQDYSALLDNDGENVFIFLDPPYLLGAGSKLYGTRGDLHAEFNHLEFAKRVELCQHRWLVTYNNSPIVQKYFSFAFSESWELQYGMNNYRQEKSALGKELFFRNYELA